MVGGPCDRRERSCVTSYAGEKVTSVRRRKKYSHARHKVTEAEFRRRASVKDGEKLVQYKSESLDERCKKRKEKS